MAGSQDLQVCRRRWKLARAKCRCPALKGSLPVWPGKKFLPTGCCRPKCSGAKEALHCLSRWNWLTAWAAEAARKLASLRSASSLVKLYCRGSELRQHSWA